MAKIEIKTTLEDIKEYSRKNPDAECVYSSCSCWWGYYPQHLYKMKDCDLPCGPRSEPLFQAPLSKYLESALDPKHESHYGKFGFQALEAAFHGNLVTENLKVLTTFPHFIPTSFQTWDEYNKLIDEQNVSNSSK